MLAFGELGSREMTVNSGLDLMLLYDHEDVGSDGRRPLDADTYYVRLCRRLMAALTAETAEGGLYRIDMRPRETGSSGPLACSLRAFEDYPHDRAVAPELAALRRLRVVWSEGGLGERFEEAKRVVLAAPRPAGPLAAGLASVRGRKGDAGGDLWAIEHMAGGLRDVAAAADFLRLLHAGERPAVLDDDAPAVFEAAQALGSIGADAAEDLAEAARLWRNLWGLVQLAADGELVEEAVGPALVGVIGRSGGKLVFEALSESVRDVAARAAVHVDAILGPGRAARG